MEDHPRMNRPALPIDERKKRSRDAAMAALRYLYEHREAGETTRVGTSKHMANEVGLLESSADKVLATLAHAGFVQFGRRGPAQPARLTVLGEAWIAEEYQ